MNTKRIQKSNDEAIDTNTFRWLHTIDNSLVTRDEFDTWKNSPITESLLRTLDYYCMHVAVECEDNGDIHIHLLGKFDIMKGILERDSQARKDLNDYKVNGQFE